MIFFLQINWPLIFACFFWYFKLSNWCGLHEDCVKTSHILEKKAVYIVGLWKRKVCMPTTIPLSILQFLTWEKLRFPKLTEKTITFLTSTVKLPLLWLKTQQLRRTTPLAHWKLPCSCDKLDIWQLLLFHGGTNSGKNFPRIHRCRKNTRFF